MEPVKVLYFGSSAEIEHTLTNTNQSQFEFIVVATRDKNIFSDELESANPDIILLDFHMSGMNAYEAIDFVKSKKIETPIIVISEEIDHDTIIRLIKRGAHDHVVQKNIAILSDIIARALKEHKEFKENSVKKTESNKNERVNTPRAGIFKITQAGRYLSVSDTLCEFLGYAKKELMGADGWLKFVSPEIRPAIKQAFYQFLQDNMPFEMQVKIITKNSEEILMRCNCIPELNEKKEIVYLCSLVDNNAQKKKEGQHGLIDDEVTGLPNRSYFIDSVELMLHECRHGVLKGFAIFFIDLDHFKKTNDVYGRECGDELLREATKRFKSNVRKYDTLARVGGDEFLVAFKNLHSAGEIAFFAENFLARFRVPFYIGEFECLTTLSIGIVYVDKVDVELTAEKIIQQADHALYRAKARGRNCYEMYSDKITSEIRHTAFIESALRHAIEKNELSVVFQPQINFLKQNIYGCEVLIRWNQAIYGDISPTVFIPIAEESQQINNIGEWVLDAALVSYKRMSREVMRLTEKDFSLSVNVSAAQFLQNNFIRLLLDKVKTSSVKLENLKFEITETSIVQNLPQLKAQFSQLKSENICLAVDDFGVGYSSFTNLKELPIRVLKIDQSFVQEIENNVNCQNIVRGIIALAKSMSLTVIAEGVETEAQAKFLLDNDCYIFQGFFFAKPLSEEDFKQFVRDFRGVKL